jgi:hypothetical protein
MTKRIYAVTIWTNPKSDEANIHRSITRLEACDLDDARLLIRRLINKASETTNVVLGPIGLSKRRYLTL